MRASDIAGDVAVPFAQKRALRAVDVSISGSIVSQSKARGAAETC